jgi:hypothetical protein
MPKESYIVYYAERLPNGPRGRGILYCDVVFDGELVDSHEVGSPAPYATVKRAERKRMLGKKN